MKLEPLDLELGADIQKLLDMKKWACKQRAKALMIPQEYFNKGKI